MGRKSARPGKLIYFCFAGLIILSFLGCPNSKKQSSSQQEVPSPKILGKETPGDEAISALQQARKLFDREDYEASLRESRRVLALSGNKPPADIALFTMGLIWAHEKNPRKDLAQALFFFQRLLRDYPRSPLLGEAQAWVGVLKENEELNRMIERSKQIDIAVENKKREKTQ